MSLGDASTLRVGQAVTALGNALGQGGAPQPADGVITALGQTITAADDRGGSEQLTGLIQFDAAIQPGDSGGPVVDAANRVIGVTTAGSQRFRFHSLAGGSTDAFAVGINAAMSVARQIEHGGGSATVHIGAGPLLGVEVNTRSSGGAAVVGVTSGGPAATAGVAAGDVITFVDGHATRSRADLKAQLQTHSPGQRITVGWVTPDGAHHTAQVTLASGPPI